MAINDHAYHRRKAEDLISGLHAHRTHEERTEALMLAQVHASLAHEAPAATGQAQKAGESGRLLSVAEAADMLSTPVATLRYWRASGVGPPGIKVGRSLKYRASDVVAWLTEQQERSWPHDAERDDRDN